MNVDDLMANFKPRPGISKRSEMAAYLRQQIVSEKIAAGTKLPPTLELAKAWGSHAPAVQAAMNALVKEGLVLRLMGRGTFVRQQTTGLKQVALYISGNRWAGQANTFVGHLMHILEYELRGQGIRAQPWISQRPPTLAAQPWEDLVQAAKRREIQGVIVAELDPQEAPWLMQLPVPVVFMASEVLPNRVALLLADGIRDSISHLSGCGCRSVGLITVLSRLTQEAGDRQEESAEFFRQFQQISSDHGLEVRESWIQSPPVEFPEKAAARFGYESFHALWNQPEKPEALLVYTDVAAQGVLMALGQRRVRVPEELHLVLHRNAEIGLFCPVAASFIDVRVQKLAAAMVGTLQRIYRGESVPQPITVAVDFVPEDATVNVAGGEVAAVAG